MKKRKPTSQELKYLQAEMPPLKKNNKTGVHGVFFNRFRKKYQGRVTIRGVTHTILTDVSLEKVAKAVAKFRREKIKELNPK